MKKYLLPLLALTFIFVILVVGIINLTVDSVNLTGKVTGTSVFVYLASPANCSFTIPPGTNQVSFFCIPNGASINDVLGNTSYSLLRTYDATDSSDSWKNYNPSMPSWVVNDLKTMSRTKGYFIETSTSQNYYYNGSKRIPNDISLVQGWNFVGYPTNEVKDLLTSFASISGNYQEIRTYNNSDNKYYSYVPATIQEFDNTTPYRTYWILMTTPDTWTVD